MTTPSPADLEAVVLEGLYADWRSPRKRAAASALALLREQAERADIAEENVRVREQSQIPMIPHAAAAQLKAAEARVRELEAAGRMVQNCLEGTVSPEAIDALNAALAGKGEG